MPHYTITSHEGKEAAQAAHPMGHHSTPVSAIIGLFECLKKQGLEPAQMLDPAAGDMGNFGFAARWVWPEILIAGIEIRPKAKPPASFYDSFMCHDFLDKRLTEANLEKFDLVATNPTFNIAEPVIRYSLAMLKPGGALALLLPINYQASVKRATGLHYEFPPSLVMPLAPRPSFYWYRADKQGEGRGNTNYKDYNWIVWMKPKRGQPWPGSGETHWKPFNWAEKPLAEKKFRAHFDFLRNGSLALYEQSEIPA